MNIEKMRRHNQTRQQDPFRGWKTLGMLEPEAQALSWAFDFKLDPSPAIRKMDQAIKGMAAAMATPSLYIAPLNRRIVVGKDYFVGEGGVVKRLFGDELDDIEPQIVRGAD